MTDETSQYAAWAKQARTGISNGLYGAVGAVVILLIYNISGCALTVSKQALASTIVQNLELRSYPAVNDTTAVSGGLWAGCHDPVNEVLVGGYCAVEGGGVGNLAFSGIARQTSNGPYLFHCDQKDQGVEPKMIAFAVCLGSK